MREVIEAFNASSAVSKINAAEIEKKLIEEGAVSKETLLLVSWEDLMVMGVPKFLAKQIATIFRGQERDVFPHLKDYISERKANSLTFDQLLEHYNPDEENAVFQKLKVLSGHKKFIVFNKDESVNIKISVRLLTELRKGLPELNHVGFDENVFVTYKTYKVGDKPSWEFDQNPIYSDRALRTDDICDVTHRSWKEIPLEIRQLVFIAINKTKELNIPNTMEAHLIIDRCSEPNAMKKLTAYFPKAMTELDELKKINSAPRLKINSSRKNETNNHPFFQNK